MLAASVTSAGASTGSAPQPCRSASATASRQRCRVTANGAEPRREAQLGKAADLQVGPADAPGQNGALLEVPFSVGSPSDHASTIPRFISATARRSLPIAMSPSDCPDIGEARSLTCSMTPAK